MKYHYYIDLSGDSESHVDLKAFCGLREYLDACGLKNVQMHVNCGIQVPEMEPIKLDLHDMPDPPVVPVEPVDEKPVEPVKPAPVEIDKATLKAKLFELRDKCGSDALEAVYESAGNGATSLSKLDPSLYNAVYAAAEEKINAAY